MVRLNEFPCPQIVKPRGFGFVEMDNDDEETAAIEELDGAEWLGRQMRVNKAKPRENKGGSFPKQKSFS